MKTRLVTSMIALSTAFAAPAIADVTAADVWSNQQAFYTAMGVNLSGSLSDGTLSNPEMNIIFPEGVASLQIKTDAVSMADNGDGTVTISYPSPMNLSVAGGAEDGGAFSAEMTVTHDGYTIIASGNPGDITYVADAQNLRFEFGKITADGMEPGEMKTDGFFNMAFWTGTSQITEGNLITYTSVSEVGNSAADFTFSAENIISHNTQTTEPVTTQLTAAFPVGGSDIMNLSAALREGLSLSMQSEGGASTSTAETTVNGQIQGSQNTSTGPQTASATFNEEGIVLMVDASDFAMTFSDPALFLGDIDFAMDQVSMAYDVPLNASEEPQDFRIATSLQGLTIGDAIWNLIDPAGQLPRDPAEVSFDVTGTGTNSTDLLDFMALAEMFGPPAIEVDEVTIENLRIAAAGVEATATGAMTFDWTDFNTIPGFARPEGQVTVNLNGANALMDKLVAMGLIPEDQLMMPRMMMGMFTTPVGDDMLETVLEVNSEGHVLANGQRLQ